MGRLRRSHRYARGNPRWFGRAKMGAPLLVAALIAATAPSSSQASPTAPAARVLAATTATSVIPKTEKNARSYITAHGGDAYRVEANVLNVQLAVLALQKNGTQTNLNKMAIAAQTAHDNIDAIRNNFAGGYGTDTLGTAELNAFSGANDLKNAMGALVAYAGAPNAATLAHFTTQYGQARAEWNQGVRVIWQLAKRKSPPTV